MTPDGREISDEDTQVRRDLRYRGLPAVGTPVAILHAEPDEAYLL